MMLNGPYQEKEEKKTHRQQQQQAADGKKSTIVEKSKNAPEQRRTRAICSGEYVNAAMSERVHEVSIEFIGLVHLFIAKTSRMPLMTSLWYLSTRNASECVTTLGVFAFIVFLLGEMNT